MTWTRTRDLTVNSRLLYQLSYHGMKVAPRIGLEPMTPGVTGRYSNQLS